MNDNKPCDCEICEYADCYNYAVTFDESLNAWLCKEHENSIDDKTGYCSRDCRLGYGCDGSC